MAREILTEQEVEDEIAELEQSEFVTIGRRATKARCQRRQRLYSLRYLEKLGFELVQRGGNVEDRIREYAAEKGDD